MSHNKKIGKVDCSVVIADITSQEADTMLVPVHQTHAGKGGVYAAAKKAGAIAGCELLENWHDLSPEFMRLGEVLTAPSGGGNTGHLSHVASVCEYGAGRDSNFAAVVLSVQSVLEDMVKHGLTSVSIPLMGTGQVGWLDTEQSSRAMLIGIQNFSAQHEDVALQVRFCIQDSDKAAVLQQVLENPENYTNISPASILAEKGKAEPAAFVVETHRAGGLLATRHATAPPKFIGAASPFRRT